MSKSRDFPLIRKAAFDGDVDTLKLFLQQGTNTGGRSQKIPGGETLECDLSLLDLAAIGRKPFSCSKAIFKHHGKQEDGKKKLDKLFQQKNKHSTIHIACLRVKKGPVLRKLINIYAEYGFKSDRVAQYNMTTIAWLLDDKGACKDPREPLEALIEHGADPSLRVNYNNVRTLPEVLGDYGTWSCEPAIKAGVISILAKARKKKNQEAGKLTQQKLTEDLKDELNQTTDVNAQRYLASFSEMKEELKKKKSEPESKIFFADHGKVLFDLNRRFVKTAHERSEIESIHRFFDPDCSCCTRRENGVDERKARKARRIVSKQKAVLQSLANSNDGTGDENQNEVSKNHNEEKDTEATLVKDDTKQLDADDDFVLCPEVTEKTLDTPIIEVDPSSKLSIVGGSKIEPSPVEPIDVKPTIIETDEIILLDSQSEEPSTVKVTEEESADIIELIVENPIKKLSEELRRIPQHSKCCRSKKCNRPASFRCNKCKIFYCSRECQAHDWKTHRVECPRLKDLLIRSAERTRAYRNSQADSSDDEGPPPPAAEKILPNDEDDEKENISNSRKPSSEADPSPSVPIVENQQQQGHLELLMETTMSSLETISDSEPEQKISKLPENPQRRQKEISSESDTPQEADAVETRTSNENMPTQIFTAAYDVNNKKSILTEVIRSPVKLKRPVTSYAVQSIPKRRKLDSSNFEPIDLLQEFEFLRDAQGLVENIDGITVRQNSAFEALEEDNISYRQMREDLQQLKSPSSAD